MAGRLIAVVGPSGVGKDSLIDVLAAQRTRLSVVRRVVTRDPGLGGEDFDPVDETTFEELSKAGAFCLEWEAHGLRYGIPAMLPTLLATGQDMLLNLSRKMLPEAKRVFPDLVVIYLTARPETLAKRLQLRGREDMETIRERLARARMAIPEEIEAIEISNDGSLDDTVAEALTAIYPVSA